MRVGQKVNFYRPEISKRVDATVEEITGAGAGGYKILTLRYREEGKEYLIEEIAHYENSEPGEPFWLLKGSRAPKGWDEEPEET